MQRLREKKLNQGGSFAGNIWHPYGEPTAEAKAKASEYGNEFESDKAVAGILERVTVFSGEDRFCLVARLNVSGREAAIVDGAPALLLPNHKSLMDALADVADGQWVDLEYEGAYTIKSGPFKGKSGHGYAVYRVKGSPEPAPF